MSCTVIVKESNIVRTPRVIQLEGMFDLSPSERSKLTWEVNLSLQEREWNVGLIVGPSGSGKTTIARELFKDYIIDQFQWSKDKAIVDEFPNNMSIHEIVEILTSIGFSSPPAWLRNYNVLSNGEQFRVFIARALTEKRKITVIDEFTSVVDRTVAKAVSYTVQKYVRRHNKKFIAISCHYDIIQWLMPDWIFEAGVNNFQWSDGLRRRPDITLKIEKVHPKAWKLFKNHHYLSRNLNNSAQCYLASWNNEPVAFCAVLSQPILTSKQTIWRISRIVVLPDYQGLGIGMALLNYVASLYATKSRVGITTSHMGMIRALEKSPLWKLKRRGINQPHISLDWRRTSSSNRITCSFYYIGRPNFEDARRFEVLK